MKENEESIKFYTKEEKDSFTKLKCLMQVFDVFLLLLSIKYK